MCVDALERRSNYRLPVELRPQPQGADAAEGRGLSRRLLARAAAAASGPFGSSTRPTRRRTTASATPPTTTTAPARMRVVDRIRVPDADPHRRGRPVRARRTRSATRSSRAIRTSRSSSRRTAATARIWNAAGERLRRLLGRAGDRPVCGRIMRLRTVGSNRRRLRNHRSSMESARMSARANSGPFPDSSCLKYTKTSSRHCAVRSYITRPTARYRPACSPRRAAGSSA